MSRKVSFLFFSVFVLMLAGLLEARQAFASTVSLNNGKLYLNGSIFNIKGVNYNPVPIGSDQLDATAPTFDIPKIADLGANTIGTYNLGKFEWYQWSDLTNGESFYNTLYPSAESKNLKIIVAYFSNQTIDWTDSARVTKATAQYQALVLKAKDRPSTLMYLIGNEIFEKLSNENQRVAYAKWVGDMVNWTHSNDPNHPVTYADNAIRSGLSYLKTYAPNLDIYSTNNYEWGTELELTQKLSENSSVWSGKPVLLHEFGTDSFDTTSWQENESSQGERLKELTSIINAVYNNPAYPLLGSVLFEYADQWDKVGSSSTQDKDNGWPWLCHTCFDGKANEDFWGIAKSVQAQSANSRILKSSYYSLQEAWGGSAPPPIDSVLPTVRIKYPADSAVLVRRSNVSILADASDNVGVLKVEFYLNGALLCTDSLPAYYCNWSVPKRLGVSYTIKAVAYDLAGNYSQDEISVTSN